MDCRLPAASQLRVAAAVITPVVIVSLGFHRLEVREEKSDTVFEVISGASFLNSKVCPALRPWSFSLFWGTYTKILRSRHFHLIFQVIVLQTLFLLASFSCS